MNLSLHEFVLSFTLVLLFIVTSSGQTERDEGVRLYKQGDYQSAIKQFKLLTKNNADDPESWYLLGTASFEAGKHKEAEKAYKMLVKLKPDDARGHVGVAYVQLSANKNADAQISAKKAVELNPENAEAHYILGILSFRNGSYNYAYERAAKAIEINPDFAAAHLLKAETLTSSFGQITGAVSKSPSERLELLKEATVNMEKYLSLLPDGKDKQLQQERLESLKFFVNYYEKPENQIRNSLETAAANGNSTPLSIKSKPRAEYTEDARKKQVMGTIHMLAGFSEDGNVIHLLVLKGLPFGLNQQAIKAAQGIKFDPATKDGKAVSVVKQIVYSFSIY